MNTDWLMPYLPKKVMPKSVAFSWAVASLLIATLLREMLSPLVGRGAPFITYFPAVMVISIWCGLAAGAATAVSSAILAAFLFLRPDPLAGANSVALASFAFSSSLQVVIGSALSRALQARAQSEGRARAAEEQLRTVVSELGHRAKNGMAIAMSIVSQSARGSDTAEMCERTINSRFGAMAKAQDVILDASGRPAELHDLLTTIIAPFDDGRFDLLPSNSPVVVSSDVAIGLGLLINELATNALKYGALSNRAGRVQISWAREGVGRVGLRWEEHGGPTVAAARRVGFGTRLVQTWLQAGGGRAERRLDPSGAVCDVTFPVPQDEG
jgi:two-component sensor histidine kinase